MDHQRDDPSYWINKLVEDFYPYLKESGIRISKKTLADIFHELALYYDLEKAISCLRWARRVYNRME